MFDVLECMLSIIRNYKEVEKKLKRIKDIPGNNNCIMSDVMLKLRWDTVSENGIGDIPPFGGMQLIIVGDFYQLPPVPAGCDDALMENENFAKIGYVPKIGRQGSYAFESHAWHHGYFHTVELREVHRQAKNDGLFEFLNDMREGEPDLVVKHKNTLAALQYPLPLRSDGIVPTELHSKNYVVDRRNSKELHKLPEHAHEFISMDKVRLVDGYKDKISKKISGEEFEVTESPSSARDADDQCKHDLKVLRKYAQEHFFEKDCRVGESIDLKIDAQVMLLWNLISRLNSPMGVGGW
ncbi:hypothetical protein ACHAXR_000507 [Thalassiosira sp. AJA248-18]